MCHSKSNTYLLDIKKRQERRVGTENEAVANLQIFCGGRK